MILAPLCLLACSGDPEPAQDTPPTSTASPVPTTTPTTGPTPTATTTADEGWCAVRTLVNTHCLQCHSAAAALGDLDLQTDAYATLLDGLVVPGDPAGSLLMRKLDGDLLPGEGTVMPPGTPLREADRQIVREWITAGATDTCGETTTTAPPEPYHPQGFSDPAVHGLELKFQAQDCTGCHGQALEDCESCHAPGWTSDCTFCHGDAALGDAEPPQDIDDNDDPASISFPEHTVHVHGDEEDPVHAGWDCTECHVKPTDLFSPGHVIVGDTTPGVAEVVFTGGVSSTAVYTPGIGCSNAWCHGYGQDGTEGSMNIGDSLVCGGCHGVATHWADLSGRHRLHLTEGLGCQECHTTAANNPYRITDFALHINGTRDVSLPPTMSIGTDGACTGVCHGETHASRAW